MQTNMKKNMSISFVLFLMFSINGCGNNANDIKNAENKNIVEEQSDSIENTLEEEIKESSMLDTIKCNISIVRKTDKNLNTLKKTEIELFLNTFSQECSNNIEYVEYSNEILYKVLKKHPSELIICLGSLESRKVDHILSEFANPLLDINGSEIKLLISRANGDSEIKKRLTLAIDKAMEY